MKSLLLVLIVLLSGCVANAPFRSGDGKECSQHWKGCGSYYESRTGFDLAFVEYTERGNDFNPEQTQKLLSRIKAQSEPNGLAMVVFVHGWKHNASTQDHNVHSFIDALKKIHEKGVVGKKKLIGIYVGWRGMSLHGLKSENLTFWDRKATAEEVGRGGVTKFLLDLEYLNRTNDKNFMMTIGHSFGGAITLSALHDVLLYKMVAAEQGNALVPFGDGVILLNPAIEANQGLLLKESSMRLGAMNKQMPSMMHVLSSRADIPTHKAFPVGQFLGVTLSWDQDVLDRTYEGNTYTLKERTLDQTTVGNYAMYQTGSMEDLKKPDVAPTADSRGQYQVERAETSSGRQNNVMDDRMLRMETGLFESWEFRSYCSPAGKSLVRFPCHANDPIDFISVPKSFISDHNDIFNNNVVAFLSAVVEQSYWDRSGRAEVPDRCQGTNKKFSLAQCFTSYLAIYNQEDRVIAPGSLLDDLFKNDAP